ncbi:MAG: hypothetical protein EHM91_12560 [Planctomycetota bacterium]|nr:MAG: hypothetical protein EHM91_12560 [Planctomycetota bacterium]
MMNMLLTLSLALAAQAADDLAPGDRVEITFHSGATLSGTLTAPPPKSDPGSLTLDVTWEYPGVNGTMTVAKKEIKAIRTLRALDDKTKQKLAEMKKRIAEENAKEQAAKPAPVPAPEPPPKIEPVPDDKAKKEAEELKKAREFHAKFPAPDWSEERRNAIRLKKFRGQVPTPAEREFEAGFELWEKGRGASEKKATPQ